MKIAEERLQFLSIEWEVADPGTRETVRLEACLCRRHREEVSLAHPDARGRGRLGDGCDYCESREPRVVVRLSPLGQA